MTRLEFEAEAASGNTVRYRDAEALPCWLDGRYGRQYYVRSEHGTLHAVDPQTDCALIGPVCIPGHRRYDVR